MGVVVRKYVNMHVCVAYLYINRPSLGALGCVCVCVCSYIDNYVYIG